MRLASLLLSLFAASAFAADAERPNIVFCFADDWGRYASAYAKLDGPGTLSDAVQTPNFDRVAREGVLFRKAFVSAPSCTPCRSALLSGQHFWRTGRGSILRGAVWDYSSPSYALLLRDAGYHLGETYKVWGPGTPNDAPYGAGKHAFEKAGVKFNQFSTHVFFNIFRFWLEFPSNSHLYIFYSLWICVKIGVASGKEANPWIE